MVTSVSGLASPQLWQQVSTGDATVAVAERAALGTSARVAVWPPESLGGALAAVDGVIGALDRQASRFRQDSEISRIPPQRGWPVHVERWARRGDRRRARSGTMDRRADGIRRSAAPSSGWAMTVTSPRSILSGVSRSVARPRRRDGTGSGSTARCCGCRPMSGSIWVPPPRAWEPTVRSGRPWPRTGRLAGCWSASAATWRSLAEPPRDGWPVLVAGELDPAGTSGLQPVRLASGAIATSSITCRQWRRAGQVLHHIVDPRTGLPADGPWQMVSVAAATCADANAAATASIVAGAAAREWLASTGLPARLVSHDGEVRYVGRWPETDGGRIDIPSGSQVYGRARPGGVR